MNLREFVDLLEEKGRLKRVTKEVDPVYEVAALMDEAGDTPLYLENVKGSVIPCITNICSSRELVALGLECAPNEILGKITNTHPPTNRWRGIYLLCNGCSLRQRIWKKLIFSPCYENR